VNSANKPQSKQDKAIHDYLESLLFEVDDTQIEDDQPSAEPPVLKTEPVTEAMESLPHSEPELPTEVIGLEKLVAEIPEVYPETVTELKTESKVELEVKEKVQLEQQTEVALEVQPETPVETESGVPDWAENRFQCLLFKVSGLSLAVPLVKLNSVIPWNEEITKTPNQTEWYLGLVQHLQSQVKVIDTAMLVMPENRHEKIESDPAERLSHILLVDDYKWGLACDSIGDVIWLTKDEVKWRKNKKTRAWLSGTSLEHLCAIMDTEVFAQMLLETE